MAKAIPAEIKVWQDFFNRLKSQTMNYRTILLIWEMCFKDSFDGTVNICAPFVENRIWGQDFLIEFHYKLHMYPNFLDKDMIEQFSCYLNCLGLSSGYLALDVSLSDPVAVAKLGQEQTLIVNNLFEITNKALSQILD